MEDIKNECRKIEDKRYRKITEKMSVVSFVTLNLKKMYIHPKKYEDEIIRNRKNIYYIFCLSQNEFYGKSGRIKECE